MQILRMLSRLIIVLVGLVYLAGQFLVTASIFQATLIALFSFATAAFTGSRGLNEKRNQVVVLTLGVLCLVAIVLDAYVYTNNYLDLYSIYSCYIAAVAFLMLQFGVRLRFIVVRSNDT
ncbi:MAG: hypothetical protein AB8B95_10055 [Pseudohongiellaceae bacterium]